MSEEIKKWINIKLKRELTGEEESEFIDLLEKEIERLMTSALLNEIKQVKEGIEINKAKENQGSIDILDIPEIDFPEIQLLIFYRNTLEELYEEQKSRKKLQSFYAV